MFYKLKKKKRANEIVSVVLNDANDLIEMLRLKGYSVAISKHETECLLLGIQIFLIVGILQDNDLGLEIVPAYQKRIMPLVNKEEYNSITKHLGDIYLEYREIAIKIQFSSDEWQSVMIEEFAKKTITYMQIPSNYETIETVISFITLLINHLV